MYVLLLPYALFRWGGGVEAVTGMAIVVAAHALPTAVSGNFSDLALGLPILSLPAALGASIRYRASSRLRETDQIRLREREQLARELHDTVAHHVSAIAIRAQAGRTLAASRPGAAVDALEVIEEAASRTLADLRGLVGALRDGDEAELAPQRGVADIERLANVAGDGDARRRALGRRSRRPATAGRRRDLPHRPGVDHERGQTCTSRHPHRRARHRRP